MKIRTRDFRLGGRRSLEARSVPPRPGAPSRQSAFTMVEVALSLGIMAFALVAIIGVLPSGLKVQRENRELTVINQDAAYLLDAIRTGARGVDDLTNYVESITVWRGNQRTTYTNNIFRPGPFVPLTNAQHIISLLSTPKLERLPSGLYRQNRVTARMRAISGQALEKSMNSAASDFAFRYEVTAEMVPFTSSYFTNVAVLPPQTIPNIRGELLRTANLARNLYEVRLTLRWPLFQKGTTWDVGRYRRTVRTLVSGELVPVYTNSQPYLYLIDPNTFISAY